MKQLYIITLFAFITTLSMANAQCPCLGGAPIGGVSPVGGTSNTGLLIEGHLRAGLYAGYSLADNYYEGFSNKGEGEIKSFTTAYTILSMGYGYSDRLTLEASALYFPVKQQEELLGTNDAKGMGNITISAMYNLMHSVSRESELTIGGGISIPAANTKLIEYQHLSASSGAYGLQFRLFFHKGYERYGLHFILMNRSEYYFENDIGYQYGPSIINSLFVSKLLSDEIALVLELRDQLHLKDKFNGKVHGDSGMNLLILAPQISYQFNKLNISMLGEYPVLSWYWGYQLGLSWSLGLNIIYQMDMR